VRRLIPDRYSSGTLAAAEQALVALAGQKKPQREGVTSGGTCRRDTVTQKARCVRLVHGGHISRVLRGKTQGIAGPRASEHAHARRLASYDVVEVPDDGFRGD